MAFYLVQNIRDFILNSLHFFPFTLFISLVVFGAIFYQPTWTLVAMGMFFVYLLTKGADAGLTALLPQQSILGIGLRPVGNVEGAVCSPYSIGSTSLPSMWIAQTAFVSFFVIYNSFVLANKAGNKNFFEAYQNRLSRTQISIIVSAFVLIGLVWMRIYSGCDEIGGAIISVGWGALIAYIWWNILDICNTQLQSDILGITRNMAPSGEEKEIAMVCTA
jgi:hypothetical protein